MARFRDDNMSRRLVKRPRVQDDRQPRARSCVGSMFPRARAGERKRGDGDGMIAATIRLGLVTLALAGEGWTVAAAAERLPGETFRDCDACDELVVVPAGTFVMGSTAKASQSPPHKVTLPRDFAIGRREVTFAEWDRCVAARGCDYSPSDQGWGRGDRPAINLSWS